MTDPAEVGLLVLAGLRQEKWGSKSAVPPVPGKGTKGTKETEGTNVDIRGCALYSRANSPPSGNRDRRVSPKGRRYLRNCPFFGAIPRVSQLSNPSPVTLLSGRNRNRGRVATCLSAPGCRHPSSTGRGACATLPVILPQGFTAEVR